MRAEKTLKIHEAKGTALLYKLKEEYPNDEEVILRIVDFHKKHQRYEACIEELKSLLKFDSENKKIKQLIKEYSGLLADKEHNDLDDY